jgi:hypothetical protein
MKKVNKKKTNKNYCNNIMKVEPGAYISLGSIIMCIFDFNGKFFIEKILVIIGALLMIIGTWILYSQNKNKKKKISYLYLGTCIIFIIVLILLVIGTFII